MPIFKIFYFLDGKKGPGSNSCDTTEPLSAKNLKFKAKNKETKAELEDSELVSMVEVMEKRTFALVEQLDALRLENQQQCEVISAMKCQASVNNQKLYTA